MIGFRTSAGKTVTGFAYPLGNLAATPVQITFTETRPFFYTPDPATVPDHDCMVEIISGSTDPNGGELFGVATLTHEKGYADFEITVFGWGDDRNIRDSL